MAKISISKDLEKKSQFNSSCNKNMKKTDKRKDVAAITDYHQDHNFSFDATEINVKNQRAIQPKLAFENSESLFEYQAKLMAEKTKDHIIKGGVSDQLGFNREVVNSGATKANHVNPTKISQFNSNNIKNQWIEPKFGSEILTSLGRGESIPRLLKDHMESAFQMDLSDVRVHADSKAANIASLMKAKAFTVGHDVFFGPGRYSPHLMEGQKLLAHEITHVAQQGNDNPIIMRDPLESQIPKNIEFTNASLSFSLPGGKEISSEPWEYNLETTNPTTVTLSVSPTSLSISFSPSLRIDAQFPACDMAWSGVNYDFRSGATSIGLVNTDNVCFDRQSSGISSINGKFSSIIGGTRLASKGYNPLTDPDLNATLNAIKNNFISMPSGSGGELKPTDVRNVTASASLSIKKEIRETTPEGGVVIPTGTSATIIVYFSGNASEVAEEASRRVELISISTNGIVLQKDGSDVARLTNINISPGGGVQVINFTPLGSLAKAEAGESLGRFFLLLLSLSGGRPEDRLAVQGRAPNLNPEAIHAEALRQINAALTRAVIELVQQYHNVIPGVDLYDIFNVQRPKGDYPIVPPAGPGSARV